MSTRRFPRFRRVHFVGIGGSGMSGIAEVLCTLGHAVSGSDLADSEATRRLASLGAEVHQGHAGSQVEGADVVVTSTAVGAENVEVARARELGIPVIPRAEMLAELMRLKYGIAVAGSHGKTTTTSLTAAIVAEGGLDPTVVVGGRLASLGANARAGKGEFLVCEADESDGSFLKLSPTIAVVTNIDEEHLETYGGRVEILEDAFVDFCNAVPFYGAAILCLDDRRLQDLLPRIERRVVTYGTSVQADLSLRDLSLAGGRTSYTAVHRGEELGRVELDMPGRHLALNSLAAIAVALELEVPFDEIALALREFAGVDRRMSLRGSEAGVTVVDDYAHHPTELIATLSALREGFTPRRLVAIFQPHRYSRVVALAEEFGRSFHDADLVLTCPVHAAGEELVEGADASRLVAAMRDHGHRGAEAVESVDAAVARALEFVADGDLVVTLGAGDVTRASVALVDGLRAREGGR